MNESMAGDGVPHMPDRVVASNGFEKVTAAAYRELWPDGVWASCESSLFLQLGKADR